MASHTNGTFKSQSLVRPVIKLEIYHHIENFRSAMRLCLTNERVFSREVSSPRAPDFVWRVYVNPNNGSNGSAFFLQLAGPAREQKKRLNVAYTLALLDENGKTTNTLTNNAISEFSSSDAWGQPNTSHTTIESALHADGSLLVVANLEFFASAAPASICAQTTYRLGVSDSLASLLRSGMQSDLTIVAGKEQLLAHRCILACRSPVFGAMLTHNSGYQEAKSGVLEIEEFAKQPVEGMLSFVYTGAIDDALVDKWQGSLLQLADKYQLDEMKILMEGRMAASLCVETFVHVALLADSHNCPVLKEACVTFLRDNFDKVISGEIWKELRSGDRASVAAELLEKVHGGR